MLLCGAGVEHMHKNDVVHGDIAPRNLLLTERGPGWCVVLLLFVVCLLFLFHFAYSLLCRSVVVNDFGLAERVGSATSSTNGEGRQNGAGTITGHGAGVHGGGGVSSKVPFASCAPEALRYKLKVYALLSFSLLCLFAQYLCLFVV